MTCGERVALMEGDYWPQSGGSKASFTLSAVFLGFHDAICSLMVAKKLIGDRIIWNRFYFISFFIRAK